MSNPLPGARARIADANGLPTSEFFRFLQGLQRLQSGSASAADITELQNQIQAVQAEIDALPAEQGIPVLRVLAPLMSKGLLQTGLMTVGWNGTTSDVPEGSRLYFTDPRVYAALKEIIAGSGLVSIAFDDTAQTVTVKSQSFEFDQATPSASWSIAHNLGKFPTVAVVDSAGNFGIGSVQYADANHLTVSFGAPFTGTAYLN